MPEKLDVIAFSVRGFNIYVVVYWLDEWKVQVNEKLQINDRNETAISSLRSFFSLVDGIFFVMNCIFDI